MLPKIEAAENARDALEEKYGEEALGEVGDLAKLTEAREKYDALHPVFKRGDVDGDGEINARDALLALQHSVQIKILEQEQFTAADVNRDSKVDAADALCMLQYSVGIIDSFPGQSDEDGLTDDDPIVDTDDPENPGNPEEPNVPENSAGPDASVSGLGGISAYTLSGLPIGKSVQQFAFAETNEEAYIFVTQREEATTYLSRCKVGEDGKSAACIDYAVLEGYGHGESLDVSMHNGQTYLFIGSDANANADKYDWSTTITRLLYEAGNIGDIKKITGVEYATADGSPIKQGETPYRVNFAVDDAADRIVVYFRSQSGTHALSAYRLSTLQEMLDAADEISLKDCAEAFLATTGVKKLADICPNGSFQGLETTPDGEILITGGTTSVQPQLTRFTVQEGAIVLESVTDLRWLYSSRVGTVDWSIGCDYYEIESIRCYEGRMYVSFTPGSANTIQNYTEIFALVDPSVQEGA